MGTEGHWAWETQPSSISGEKVQREGQAPLSAGAAAAVSYPTGAGLTPAAHRCCSLPTGETTYKNET